MKGAKGIPYLLVRYVVSNETTSPNSLHAVRLRASTQNTFIILLLGSKSISKKNRYSIASCERSMSWVSDHLHPSLMPFFVVRWNFLRHTSQMEGFQILQHHILVIGKFCYCTCPLHHSYPVFSSLACYFFFFPRIILDFMGLSSWLWSMITIIICHCPSFFTIVIRAAHCFVFVGWLFNSGGMVDTYFLSQLQTNFTKHNSLSCPLLELLWLWHQIYI